MRVLIRHEEIVQMCEKIGKELTNKFKNKTPIVVCVLKGSEPFHAELIKHMDMDIQIDYIQASSYAGGTESSGLVTIKKDLDSNIENRDVIIVEDIVDTGLTLSRLKKELEKREISLLAYDINELNEKINDNKVKKESEENEKQL